MLSPSCCLANHPITHQISYSVISAFCSVHIHSVWKISLHLTLTGSVPKCFPHTSKRLSLCSQSSLSLFVGLLVCSLAMPALGISFVCTVYALSHAHANIWQFYKGKQCTTFCLPDVTFISGCGEPGGSKAGEQDMVHMVEKCNCNWWKSGHYHILGTWVLVLTW